MAGSTPTGAGAAFGFAGAGVGDALAVALALGFLAGVTASGEAAGSAVARTGAGAAVDPGGHTVQFQHSALAGNDRNASPVAAMSPVSRSDFSFIDLSPVRFFDVFVHPHFAGRVQLLGAESAAASVHPLSSVSHPFGGTGASKRRFLGCQKRNNNSLKIKGAF